MLYERQVGVPRFSSDEYRKKLKDYALLIPVINEDSRIHAELAKAVEHSISDHVDIIICDGGSTDGSVAPEILQKLNVNTLLIKQDEGKQGAQLRMGIWWALQRNYQGIVTIDGNNKDSIEDVPLFIEKLREGYDFVQGSRFVPGGRAIRTPLVRNISIKFIHAPIIPLIARQRFTDTTNAFRAYSRKYLTDERVQPLRDIFMTYELLAYLSVRASQLGLRACEVPVTRTYPQTGKTPTKISFFKGNVELLKILFKNAVGAYNP